MSKERIKKMYTNLRCKINDVFYKDEESLRIDWYGETNNFGDVLNPILVKQLTGKPVLQYGSHRYSNHHYSVIGSILDRATDRTIVWGTGFIAHNSSCKEPPLKICAVRGPKTREKLINDGIPCPEVYGDPALLLPKIYLPEVNKKYNLGIIPHYIDKDNTWINSMKNNPNIKIIDIQESDPLDFIDTLLSCEKIASSSLHGIIVADAYKIPSIWIELSDNVTGKGFKFIDYFLSVGRKDKEAYVVNQNTKINDLMKVFYEYKIDIDLDNLLNSAPFEVNIKPIKRFK